jgi:hypothetical protein
MAPDPHRGSLVRAHSHKMQHGAIELLLILKEG